MGNCIFAWPNMIDSVGSITPAFSGGSWETALPLSNLVDPSLARVARTTGVTLANTQFDIDYGAPAYCRIFAAPRHSLSVAAKVRVRGSTVAGSFGVAQTLRAGVAGSYRQKVLPTFSTTSTKAVSLYVQSPSANASGTFRFRVYRTSGAPGAILDVNVVMSLGVPTPTAATGTYNSTDAPVNGWHRIKCTTTSATNTDTYRIEVYPNGASEVGLDMMIFGVQVEDNNVHDAYQSGGANLLSNPDTYDFSGWTVGSGSTSTTYNGSGEPGSGQVMDTTWLDAWPVMWPANVLPWGHPNLWTLKLTPDQIATYRAGFSHVAASAIGARYWRWEFDDTTNAAGYIDVARLVMSPGYEPSVNFAYGAQAGLVSETSYEQSLGGARFYDERPIRKVMLMNFPELPIDEALGVMQEMLREQQTSRQVFFVFDAADTIHRYRRAFLGTFRDLSALEYAYFGAGGMAIAMEEVL